MENPCPGCVSTHKYRRLEARDSIFGDMLGTGWLVSSGINHFCRAGKLDVGWIAYSGASHWEPEEQRTIGNVEISGVRLRRTKWSTFRRILYLVQAVGISREGSVSTVQ